uniref:AP (Apurinic) endonuclease family 2 n=1 Tax=Marseillevirus LCMAC101 TaxID=2506602 RepID=A0A481YSF3_9VIRU|nr:MAG: AP (apurinic) endonuclease family 2 [Marseillevirus LCMAC101]
MNYGQLGKDKIIPKTRLFTKVPRFGKLPTIASKIGYCEFGLFMEKMIETFIIDDKSPDDMKEVFDMVGMGKWFKPDQFEPTQKLVKRFRNRNDIRFQVEMTDSESRIQGHPDLVTTKTIYDIKTTAKFNGMRIDTVLQLLSYFCLARRLGMKKLTHIGLILPAQNLILNVSLKNWDWKPFYEKLKGCTRIKEGREEMIRGSYRRNRKKWEKYFPYVGTHMNKELLFQYIQRRPQVAYQFFVGGRSNTHANCTEAYKKTLKKTLEIYPCARVFIHSPYTLALSRKYVSSKEVEKAESNGKPHPEGRWIYEVTTKLLKMGADLGLKGIVIHCGQKKDFTWKEAVDNMREHVNKIARQGTPECPLLIETSAKEGGETLYDPEDMAEFYWSLDEKARANVAICVDTCHVFSANHDPMSYVKVLEVRQVPIKLIHFNSSLFEKGCCKDRHATPDEGWISYDQLTAVLKWAVKRNIPLVTE